MQAIKQSLIFKKFIKAMQNQPINCTADNVKKFYLVAFSAFCSVGTSAFCSVFFASFYSVALSVTFSSLSTIFFNLPST